jgi:hypothetical protein
MDGKETEFWEIYGAIVIVGCEGHTINRIVKWHFSG